MCGDASRLPGIGETVTDPESTAELSIVAGVHLGAERDAAALAMAGTSTSVAAGPRMRARMASMDPKQDRAIDRRTFLRRGLAAGGLLAAGAAIGELADASTDSPSPPNPNVRAGSPPARRAARAPNILVILVDQLRFPQWVAPSTGGNGLPPNLARLSREGVSFARHYTASNDCSPARAALLTGLYTHQTGCMITGGSTLDPGFPTWGTMLRDRGYRTRWFGKWHLTRHDNWWTKGEGERALERYGFSGGIYPSPDGAPGQGWRKDPHIAGRFAEWFAHEGGGAPWCTTVSFVNPHDIAWWYVWSDRVEAEASAASVTRRLPPNFETPERLIEQNKPRLQLSLQDTAASSFGPVPFSGGEATRAWLSFLDLYMKLQREVDRHVGNVLRALRSRPEVAANTVILFTSDHGEYGGSHGLRGKGAGVYEEGIRVPLIVSDPRGLVTSAPELLRTQLTSSVDVAPLLLTIATGSDEWRREPHYAQIAGRLDLARILADPASPGRPYVLHATDEIVTEFAIEEYAASAPLHVRGLRTPTAKYATYSRWPDGVLDPLYQGSESELYDYRTQAGRLELANVAGRSSLEDSLRAQLERAVSEELRAPLPSHLSGPERRGLADYHSTSARAAKGAAAARRHPERQLGRLNRSQGLLEPRAGDLTPAPPPRSR
ncbi:MAG TPA: sulfatase-like hydrolase/transferase [Solirubrobacteraceae bacterium]|nr:sulfatase-like hydrolase/transferase [Solirubrobacteraceae bacterium]